MPREIPTIPFQTDTQTEYVGSAELLAIEQNLRYYNSDIVSKMTRYFAGKRPVLEFGAGIGTLAREWHKETGVKPECLEIDARQQQTILDRGFACYGSLGAVTKKFGGIYSSNVLEHIEDDVRILEQLNALLVDGGILAIYVPAFMCLFSNIDKSLGHYRRYHKAELIDKAVRTGFQIVTCQYVDSIGFFSWYAAKLLGNVDGANLSSSRSLRFYDSWLYPISRALDALFAKRLVGKNLLLVAKK